MQVKNIECQIAQAQLRRYLTGEELPSAVVKDLETHLRHCPECMAFAEQQREVLKSSLTSKITGRPAKRAPIKRQETKREEIKQAIETGHAAVETPMDILDRPDSAFKPQKIKSRKYTYRTLGYSLALGAVLVLMSTVFKDPTKFFGPRASTVAQDTPPVSETKTPETKQPEQTTSDQKTADQPKTVVPDSTSPKQPLSHTEKPTTATTDPGAGSDSFIIADSVDGTKVVKSEKAKPQKPEPATGTGTIKVYPPDGH